MKSQPYWKLWQACGELRGGMDDSQYKDHLLTLLFVKYVTDKFAADPAALIEVPPRLRFADMVAAEGEDLLGDAYEHLLIRSAGNSRATDVPDGCRRR